MLNTMTVTRMAEGFILLLNHNDYTKNQRPYYNVHDYAAASRAVDFLIDKYLHMPSQASGTASAVPLIKVKGKVIEHGQPTAPAVAGPSQDEMLKTIDVAMQVLERASEAAPQQPGQQPGP